MKKSTASFKTLILGSIAVSSLLLSGCATSPQEIESSYVSPAKYINNNCRQLSVLLKEAQGQLVQYSTLQNYKVSMNPSVMLFILLPTSNTTWDYSKDVAKVKGEIEAIKTVQYKAGCLSD